MPLEKNTVFILDYDLLLAIESRLLSVFDKKEKTKIKKQYWACYNNYMRPSPPAHYSSPLTYVYRLQAIASLRHP
jgi:hypothetical protein